jgi:DNA-directed RNA polymerase specialized sigma24 family protein
MSDRHESSVTEWIALLKAGDLEAAQPLWERYFERLVHVARARLRPRGYVDGEDVALSAFDSVCNALGRGRFPQLGDRNDLWRLLVYITAQKIARVIEYDNAVRRGGGVEPEGGSAIIDVAGREPSPDFAVEMADELGRLFRSMGDDTLRKIALWKLEGFTNDEIAVRLGCSLKTVSNKLKLIRMKLENECHAG